MAEPKEIQKVGWTALKKGLQMADLMDAKWVALKVHLTADN